MFRHTLQYWVAIAALVASMASCSMAPPSRTKEVFMEREVRVSGTSYRYRVFVPATKKASKRPVIVFLHGSGERGDDNRKQLAVGLGPYVEKHADEFPAIVVFPQAPQDSEWNDNVAMTLAAVDAATREFGGDRDRTYLTGMSMGGYGTWEFALREPHRFAALVPVCGGIVAPDRRPSMQVSPVAGVADPFAEVARRLHDVPVWIFHGALDDLVPPEQSRRMAAALQAAGAADARYTEFPDANHNSWDPAYSQTPELWPWLFAQRRSKVSNGGGR
ncbi:prolyl oligopeptidase family serine peptidase [Lysobacter niabensis]|uniref:carboxylesterase family protein n=1 Tax=Agrilutibacter niabensis TaxID=380628 RepID=UPI00361E3AA8